MSSWDGKSRSGHAGYRIFVFLIRTFGVPVAYILLRFVAFYYFLFSRSSSVQIYLFYRRRMNFGRMKSFMHVYKNYYSFGQTLIDKVAVMSDAAPGFTFHFDGENHLREMLKHNKGGLLLSAHLGNWEAAAHLLQRLNTKINIVMYDGEDVKIREYMQSVTSAKKFNVIYVQNDLSHIFRINEALASNELVCIHADRFRPGNKTIETDFFNGTASFPEGPFILARKLEAPVAYVYACKESVNHYHLFSSELKHFYETKSLSLKDVLNDYVKSLEKMVLRYPEQWFNYYDFYKKLN